MAFPQTQASDIGFAVLEGLFSCIMLVLLVHKRNSVFICPHVAIFRILIHSLLLDALYCNWQSCCSHAFHSRLFESLVSTLCGWVNHP